MTKKAKTKECEKSFNCLKFKKTKNCKQKSSVIRRGEAFDVYPYQIYLLQQQKTKANTGKKKKNS